MVAPSTVPEVEDPRPVPLDAELVRALVADQHPRWADLPVRPVDRQGCDHRTFRIGDELASGSART